MLVMLCLLNRSWICPKKMSLLRLPATINWLPVLESHESGSLSAVTVSCCGTRPGAVDSGIGSTVEDTLEDSNGIEQMDSTNRSEVSL
jgi:hypothetical protein